jgi:carboxyl-terminal processing protease
VMINRFSASAAEIAAAALQDYGRAVIVGDTSTHGKGTVQNLNPLKPIMVNATPDPGTLKITIRKFYRVTGASTQLKGVVSDIILPDILNYSDEIGETSLENPLPWDTIPTENIPNAKYNKLNLVEPYLTTLREHSDERLATNQDFIYINQDIEQFKKLQADKTASLNEREQIKERETNQSRQKARDKERDSRKPSDMKIYELTVENSGQPGLPEPIPLTTTNFSDTDFSGYFGTNNIGVNFQIPALASQKNNNIANMEKPVIKNILPLDPSLNETVSILEDYISLLSASHTLIAK